jgi:hypothetical protein
MPARAMASTIGSAPSSCPNGYAKSAPNFVQPARNDEGAPFIRISWKSQNRPRVPAGRLEGIETFQIVSQVTKTDTDDFHHRRHRPG